MSAGNSGQGTPDGGDDPFAYLYRPEAGQAPPPAAPRQPSYNQVRPVGERTFGGQQGYRQQHSPDARYAAPETQPGGYGGPPSDRRRGDQDNRRNGLLIGAIAVVLAVVIGVGAAILFSGDGEGDEASGEETAEPTDDGEGEDEGASGDEEPSEEPEPDELPAADITQLPLTGGAALEATFQGSRSEAGSYIALLNRQGSTITWTFDFQGEPGMYRVYMGYSTISDGQSLSFSVNGTPREDPVDLQDYNPNSDSWDDSWAHTYNLVELVEGENTLQYSCTASCDVAVDQLYVSEDQG
ncbi:hypothetical protein FH609_029050 [Streptomyces sp. 3MP-14]|uniref:Carbohydrate-binding protein n=1 Tax=Streptomyces mimosae TaxID=2586635 RepID=A0A5N5ZRE0_9ACTN|nr:MULTISPECIES: hypothetical protein [Streptomyces]KAB8158835.1 hypothetical protein FH607_029025 [Streptomyces mimosae]KAB8172737.1 hypothetical protein FH609_029050 [Streptomyces sp. 3MP-14]